MLRRREVGISKVNATHSFKLRPAAIALAVIGALALAGMLLAASASSPLAAKAHAQAAACPQYNPNCGGHKPPGGPGGNQGNQGGGALPSGGAAGPVGGQGGELPFTGYPLTPLILLLLILLAAGLGLRAYVALRDRLSDRHAIAAPGGPAGLS